MDQKTRNKNNRKRGGAFEKRGADFLDMDVVPYSGSNARFGYGDVRDSIWLGEFKNITPKNDKVTVKIDWLYKNMERAAAIDHKPFLAWMPAAKVDKYIILDKPTADLLDLPIHNTIELENRVHNTKNIIVCLTDSYIKDIRKGKVIELIQNGTPWIMMNMAVFKEYINMRGLKGTRSTI